MKIIITVKPDIDKNQIIKWIDNVIEDNTSPWIEKIEWIDKIIKCNNPCDIKGADSPCCYFCDLKNNCDRKCDNYINNKQWETCESRIEE